MDDILTTLGNLTYTKQRNPDFAGIKNGQAVDSSGNPTTVYVQPNRFQRMLSPEADNTADQNAALSAQLALAGPQAQQQQDIQMGNAQRLVANMPASDNPYSKSFFALPNGAQGPMSPSEQNNSAANAWASSLVNPSLSPSNIRNQIGAQGAVNQGTVGQTGGFEEQGNNKMAAFNSLLSAGKYKEAHNLIDIFHNQAIAEGAAAAKNASPDVINANTTTIGNQAAAGAAQSGTALTLANQANADKDLLAGTQHNQNLTGFGLAEQENQNLPLNRGRMANSALFDNVLSEYASPTPMLVLQKDDNGNVYLGRSPLGASTAAQQYAGMGALTGGSNPTGMGQTTTTLSSGKIITSPSQQPQHVSPRLIGNPTVNGAQYDAQYEAAQDAMKRHNKGVDAIHKSAQADKDVQISALKAEKAKLAAQHSASGL